MSGGEQARVPGGHAHGEVPMLRLCKLLLHSSLEPSSIIAELLASFS